MTKKTWAGIVLLGVIGACVAIVLIARATRVTSPHAALPADERRLAELTDQLQGTGEVFWDASGQPSTATAWTRRNHAISGQIDAALALGLLGPDARPALPALIDALSVPDHDTGDGVLSVRDAAARSLASLAASDSAAQAALVEAAGRSDLSPQAAEALAPWGR